MTPVEERIDVARVTAERILSNRDGRTSLRDPALEALAQEFLLLTEHSAREEQVRNFIFGLYETWEPEPPESGPLFDLVVLYGHPDAALPATESAQPEEESTGIGTAWRRNVEDTFPPEGADPGVR